MTANERWDYAVVNGFGYNPADRGVYFTNGQPPWREVNGQRLSETMLPTVLDNLAADGWVVVETAVPYQDAGLSSDVPLLAVLPDPRHPFTGPTPSQPTLNPEQQTVRFRRPAPPLPYEYQAVMLTDVGELPVVDPADVQAIQAIRHALASTVDTALQPYVRAGWELDPYPSAVEPLLTHHLFGKWRVTGVQLRLRRPLAR